MKISEILEPERVVVHADLGSKKGVLERLAAMLSSADPQLSAATVFDSLVARERLGTTGLGEGIAIPHGRVASNGRSIGAFLRTDAPIDFDAVDNAPVDLFFALCVPEEATEEHLALLSALASHFTNPEFVNVLRTSDDVGELYRQLTSEEDTS